MNLVILVGLAPGQLKKKYVYISYQLIHDNSNTDTITGLCKTIDADTLDKSLSDEATSGVSLRHLVMPR